MHIAANLGHCINFEVLTNPQFFGMPICCYHNAAEICTNVGVFDKDTESIE